MCNPKSIMMLKKLSSVRIINTLNSLTGQVYKYANKIIGISIFTAFA